MIRRYLEGAQEPEMHKTEIRRTQRKENGNSQFKQFYTVILRNRGSILVEES